MGKIFLRAGIISLLCTFLITCKRDKVLPVDPLVPVAMRNTPLLMEFTGTNNVSSGSWGWDMAEELMTYSKGKALFMSVYPSSSVSEGFVCNDADNLNTWLAIPSYPAFAVNENPKIVRQGSVDVAKEKLLCKQAIDSFCTTPVIANAGLTHTIQGDNIIVQSTVYFFTATSGKFYVSYYLLEDGAMYKQAGHPLSNGSTPIAHPCVLRTTFNGIWGDLVAFGAVNKGYFIDKVFKLKLDPSWVTAKLRVVAVIWKADEVSGNYHLINSSTSR